MNEAKNSGPMTAVRWLLFLGRVESVLDLRTDQECVLELHRDDHYRPGYPQGEIVELQPRRWWFVSWKKRRSVCTISLNTEGLRCIMYNQMFLDRVRQILTSEAPHFGLAPEIIQVV